MKKVLLTFAFISLLAYLAPAAVCLWTANGWNTAISGTAYLVQVDSGASIPTTDDIAQYLTQNGSEYTGSDYTLLTQSGLSSATNLGSGVSWDMADTDYLSNVFTLIITEENEFYLSSFTSGTVIPGPPGGNDQYNFTFDLFEGTEWTTGTLAGGEEPVDPNVPEPTALALLALGVAGVALRRRIR